MLLKSLFAFILGILLVLAFAPFRYGLVCIPCLSLLLLLWQTSQTAKQSAWLGFLFGVGFFGVGISWIFISIHNFGHANLLLSTSVTALVIMLLAGFPAMQAFLYRYYFTSPTMLSCLVGFPAIWILSEWVRSWIFGGFPWLLIGHSQVDDSLLAAYLPVLGILGTSELVALCSGLLVATWHQIRRKQSMRWTLTALLLIGLMNVFLEKIRWTQSIDKPIKISLIQGNIPEVLKWDQTYLEKILSTYLTLTEKNWSSRLIIWPEAAVPLIDEDLQPFLHNLDQKAKAHQTTLMVGLPVHASQQYYNGILLLGLDQGHYYKRQLVLLGEYLPGPLVWLIPILKKLDIPMSDFSPGPVLQKPLIIGKTKIAPFICYEIAYSNLLHQSLPDAQLLVTISDDAWFGKSFAPAQHLQIAQSQASASKRCLLFVSNTGLTAVITPDGKINTALKSFQRSVLTTYVEKMQGKTVWIFLGDWPIVVLSIISLLCSYKFRDKKNYSIQSTSQLC